MKTYHDELKCLAERLEEGNEPYANDILEDFEAANNMELLKESLSNELYFDDNE